MKSILSSIVILLLLTSPASAQSSSDTAKVLICNSSTAYAYHSHYCSGLNRCTHSVSKVKVSEAVKLERTACKVCYPNGYTSKSNSGVSAPSSSYKPSSNSGSGCSSVQCSGTTQKGLRCKNKTTNCSGRCYLH
jgi:hypothetical protein